MSESRSTNPWKPWQRLLDPIGPDYRRQLLKARNRATRAIDDLYKDELARAARAWSARSLRVDASGTSQPESTERRSPSRRPSVSRSTRRLCASGLLHGRCGSMTFQRTNRRPKSRRFSTSRERANGAAPHATANLRGPKVLRQARPRLWTVRRPASQGSRRTRTPVSLLRREVCGIMCRLAV